LNYVFMVKLVPDWITGKRAALEVREAAEKL
jgi:5-nitroimidazole antibiotic resistance protein nimB